VAKKNRLKVTRGHYFMHLKRRVGVLFLVLLLILPVVGLSAAESPQIIDLNTATAETPPKEGGTSSGTLTYNKASQNIDTLVINGTSVNLKAEGLKVTEIKLNGKKVSSIKKPGTYTITVKATDSSKRFKGETTITIVVKKSKKAKIAKSDRKKIQNKTYKVSKNGKKKAKLNLKYTLLSSKSKKAITYKLTGKNKKYFKINKKGEITPKKGAKIKTGKTYKVTVKTVRKETQYYSKKVSKPLKIKIKVTK
jgi:hypothetical protein